MLLFFFFSVVIGDRITHEQRLISRRVGLVIGEKPIQEKKKSKGRKKGEKQEDGNSYVAKQSTFQRISDKIFEELLAADIMMKPEEFIIMWVSITFVPALLAGLFSGNPLLPVVLAILGFVIPIIVIKNKQGKRVKEFESQLSDALLICCNCLRSGLTFAQAMENIADEMEAPIGTEFKRSVNEMNYGATLDDALYSMMERIDSPDLVFTVAAVTIQRQTGGNLSEILEIIANTIKRKRKGSRQKQNPYNTGKGFWSGNRSITNCSWNDSISN